jgi:subtilisin family serine protease
VPEDQWSDPPRLPREFEDGSAAHPDPRRSLADGSAEDAAPRRLEHVPTAPELVADNVVSPPLRDILADDPGRSVGIMVELSSGFPGGIRAAAEAVTQLLGELGAGPVVRLQGYVATELPAGQVLRLVELDKRKAGAGTTRGAVYRIWPNFETNALTIRSIVTTKCQAAHRSFAATGQGVTWAVLDSGIQGDHKHFVENDNLAGSLHKSFVESDDASALEDQVGHGTHVAGILAGTQTVTRGRLRAATWRQDDADEDLRSTEKTFTTISGMAPATRLVSCQILRPDGSGDVTALIGALQYVNELNSGGAMMVHGVNVSVGYPFDPSWFATGLTPVCQEVDRLVRSGVIVVVAAGNSGFGYALNSSKQQFRLGLDMTINDPGNAALAITVGSTSNSPHSTGVSYFSSKGPTGDGRIKPDLVAPGERIISAAAGRLLAKARQEVPRATYVENSGTSMAAPHVSGAAAAFLSVHPEFLGQPDRVREALVTSATDLGRSPHFQGAGLVDAMRTIQSV